LGTRKNGSNLPKIKQRYLKSKQKLYDNLLFLDTQYSFWFLDQVHWRMQKSLTNDRKRAIIQISQVFNTPKWYFFVSGPEQLAPKKKEN
jgi:hypothetical protein